MKKLRVAIIGQGRSGRNIHGKFFRSEDNEHYIVKYVVDADEYRREKAKTEYDKLRGAIESATMSGYGVVVPAFGSVVVPESGVVVPDSGVVPGFCVAFGRILEYNCIDYLNSRVE